MQHLWIINATATTTIFYRNYSDMDIDPDLVSGLLVAVNNFSEVELKSNGISSIEMGGLRWVYSHNLDTGVLLIAADKKTSNAQVMRSRLEIIYNMFATEYKITPETFTGGLVNLDRFRNFTETLDMLRMQWAQAEKVMGAAAMFDVLGVFQQLFNHLTQIMRLNFFGNKYNEILDLISKFSEEFAEIPEILANPDLTNITFDKDMGWSVININPINIDAVVLRKALFQITSYLKSILVDNLSKMSLFYAYSKDIFPYLLAQYELLDRLGVNRSLLGIFLV